MSQHCGHRHNARDSQVRRRLPLRGLDFSGGRESESNGGELERFPALVNLVHTLRAVQPAVFHQRTSFVCLCPLLCLRAAIYVHTSTMLGSIDYAPPLFPPVVDFCFALGLRAVHEGEFGLGTRRCDGRRGQRSDGAARDTPGSPSWRRHRQVRDAVLVVWSCIVFFFVLPPGSKDLWRCACI